MSSAPMVRSKYEDILFKYILMVSKRSAPKIYATRLSVPWAPSLTDSGYADGGAARRAAVYRSRRLAQVDGDYVDKERLLVRLDRFVTQDLAMRFGLNHRLVLIVSLEVQHILSVATDIVVDLSALRTEFCYREGTRARAASFKLTNRSMIFGGGAPRHAAIASLTSCVGPVRTTVHHDLLRVPFRQIMMEAEVQCQQTLEAP